MTTYRFRLVKQTGVKALPCPACGKAIRRQRMFSMTASPFNTNPDGSVRTESQISAALTMQRQAWALIPEAHTSCQPTSA